MKDLRRARHEDWPAIDAMFQRFRAAAMPWAPYDPPKVRRLFAHLVHDPYGFAIVLDDGAPVGMLLAHAAPSLWSYDMVAQEVAFWIDPDARGGPAADRMLDQFEEWCRRKEVCEAGISCLDERTGKLFERRGYRRAEMKYRVI